MKKSDVILLLFSGDDYHPINVIELEELLFLTQKEIFDDEKNMKIKFDFPKIKFNFLSVIFGLKSAELEKELHNLQKIGFLKKELKSFKITNIGALFVEDIIKKRVNKKIVDQILNIKKNTR